MRTLSPQGRSRAKKKRFEERMTFLSSVPSFEAEPRHDHSLDTIEVHNRVR